MSNNAIGIPKYGLTKFKKVHRQNNTPSSPFGYNQIDPSKTIGGFEIYSSEGLIASMGPLKCQFTE